MNKETTKNLKYLSVHTNLQAGGTGWVKQCFKDWPDLYTCCVPGATPKDCGACLGECITANAGWDYDVNGVYNCTMTKKCFG